ncbi:MAG: GAF domain-containing protein, partial [Polyangiaceae bacterium]
MTGDLLLPGERLHGLFDTMRAFAEATIDYQRLLNTVAEHMARLVGNGCVVALLSEDEQSLIPSAVFFDDPCLTDDAQRVLGSGPIPLAGSELGQQLIRQRQTILIQHGDVDALTAQLSAADAAALKNAGMRSLLALPLELRGRLIGVIALLRLGTMCAAFTAEDEAVARNLAEHATLAISNSQLLESQKREIRERMLAQERAERFESLIQHSGEFIAM